MCVMFLHYISDEKIRTTRDQIITQSNIPASNFVLLNSVDGLIFKVIAVELEVSYYIVSFVKDCIL